MRGIFPPRRDYISCRQADQITLDDYEEVDKLHYKVENELLRLIESLPKKQTQGQWEDSLQFR
jgi:hypothetical protein